MHINGARLSPCTTPVVISKLCHHWAILLCSQCSVENQ